MSSAAARTPSTCSSPTAVDIADAIYSFSNSGNLSAAFVTFSLLRRHHSPSPTLLLRSLSSLLFCSTKSVTFTSQTLQLHSVSLSLGFLNRSPLLSYLSSFYSTTRSLSEARSLVKHSGTVDNLPWNVLISAYLRNGNAEESLDVYNDMVETGAEGDRYTFSSIFRACGDTQDVKLGKLVEMKVRENGVALDLFVCNSLMGMYVKFGEIEGARKVFDEMPQRDVVSWNTMVSGYAGKGMWTDAFRFFEKMRKEGVQVNSITWNTVLGGKLQTGALVEVVRLISEMIIGGPGVDFVTLVIGLNACSRMGSLWLGKEIHGFIVRLFLDGVETVSNALITMYARCKDADHAYVSFQMAKIRSVVTWNSMLSGFAIEDKAKEASMVFRDMVLSGTEPNYVSVVTILSLCARVANLQHGRELHCYIIKHGFEEHRLLWNSLVDVYSKSGRISIAQRVFDAMKDCDEISYTSLIAGYGIQGEGNTALKLFEQMIKHGFKPDHVSMVAILSACGHCGLVVQGESLFKDMVELYGIKPQLEHYSCMVILFARAGFLSKAEKMLNEMPFPSTPAMWAALLGACHVRGNKEINERAARKLLEMKTQSAGHYVLIANKYAASGSWERCAEVRTLMRDMGVRKAPGCAWADLGNGFHPFLVGDRSKPVSDKIYLLLDILTDQIRDSGYICTENFDFDEDIR